MESYIVFFFLFIFGLGIGSFLNVLSLRYQPNFKPRSRCSASLRGMLLNFETLKLYIGGRSHCMHCGKTLNWHELIPLFSFLIQKGKCRSCGQKLSWQYPLVEFLSGLIFVFVPLSLFSNFLISKFPNFLNFSISQFLIIFVWILIFLLFLLLSTIDFRLYVIPDGINLFLVILGTILIIVYLILPINQLTNSLINHSFIGHYSLLFNFWPLSLVATYWSLFISHLFAAFVAMAFIAAIIILSRGRGMGWGDFKLVGALGLIFGWPDIVMIIALSFIVGSIFVLPLLIKKQKTMKDAVPFGPFLIAGAALTFFFGYQIIDGYFKLFKIIISA